MGRFSPFRQVSLEETRLYGAVFKTNGSSWAGYRLERDQGGRAEGDQGRWLSACEPGVRAARA